jgi:hypothetical protein
LIGNNLIMLPLLALGGEVVLLAMEVVACNVERVHFGIRNLYAGFENKPSRPWRLERFESSDWRAFGWNYQDPPRVTDGTIFLTGFDHIFILPVCLKP